MVFNQGVVNIVIRATDQFSKTFALAGRRAQTFTQKIRDNRAALLGASAALIGFGGAVGFGLLNATKAAVEFEESISKFNEVFKSIRKDADKMAKTLQRDFGLSRKAAIKLLGDTGDLLTGFNFTEEAALDLANQVQELAVDLASFTNIEGGAERASRILTKGLIGERETMKELGIAILEADVQQRLFEKGQKRLTGVALKQAKALATLELATEQSKKAVGDFERTQGSAANQAKLLQAQLEDLKIEIGTALIPEFNSAVQALQDLTEGFVDLPESVKGLTIDFVEGAAAASLFVGGILALLALVSIAGVPLGVVAGAVGGLTAAFVLLKNSLEDLRIAWKSFTDFIPKAIETAKNKIINVFNSIIGIIEKSINIMIGLINAFITALNVLPGGDTPLVARISAGRVETRPISPDVGAVEGLTSAFGRQQGFVIENIIQLDGEEISRAQSDQLNTKVSI